MSRRSHMSRRSQVSRRGHARTIAPQQEQGLGWVHVEGVGVVEVCVTALVVVVVVVEGRRRVRHGLPRMTKKVVIDI